MPKPFFLFAPGAGAPSTHPWMQKWKHYLESIGEVALFDYDYMREGRKRPDPPPQLIAAHRSGLAEAREKSSGPIFLIGKSMGGRIGCHVALEEAVAGLVCLGYPLCGGGDRTKLRDKVLRELQTPILFVQGTRDPLCPLDLLAEVRSQMKAPNFLHLVEDGDHSLRLTKRGLQAAGETQSDIDQRILAAISKFVHEDDARSGNFRILQTSTIPSKLIAAQNATVRGARNTSAPSSFLATSAPSGFQMC